MSTSSASIAFASHLMLTALRAESTSTAITRRLPRRLRHRAPVRRDRVLSRSTDAWFDLPLQGCDRLAGRSVGVVRTGCCTAALARENGATRGLLAQSPRECATDFRPAAQAPVAHRRFAHL